MKVSKITNLIVAILAPLVISACAVSKGDDAANTGCYTFDQIFDISKIDDSLGPTPLPSGQTKGGLIQICDKDPFPLPMSVFIPGSTQVLYVPGTNCKGVVSWAYDKVQTVVSSSSEKLWKAIATDTEYKNFISGCIVIVIMFYGLMVMFGMVQVNAYSAVVMFLKIAFVWILTTNFGFFQKYVIFTFEAIVNDTTKAASNIFTDGPATPGDNDVYGVLEQIDLMISYVWDPKIMKLTIALITAGSSGVFWALTLFAMTTIYLLGVLNAVKIFIISLIGRYVLYALGPIFITFALFNQTRSLFDSWLEQIMSFTLQPVFLFVFLGIFHILIAGMLINLHNSSVGKTNFGSSASPIILDTVSAVCWMPTNTSGVAGKPSDKQLKVGNCRVTNGSVRSCGLTPGTPCKCMMNSDGSPTGFQEISGQGGKIELDFVAMLSIIIICYMLMPMADWVVTLAASLSGGMVTASSARIPGMDRIQGEMTKGFNKIKSEFMSSGGGGDGPRTG